VSFGDLAPVSGLPSEPLEEPRPRLDSVTPAILTLEEDGIAQERSEELVVVGVLEVLRPAFRAHDAAGERLDVLDDLAGRCEGEVPAGSEHPPRAHLTFAACSAE
jgi:hypothetical protein